MIEGLLLIWGASEAEEWPAPALANAHEREAVCVEPAVEALLRVGRPACKPLMDAYSSWSWSVHERGPLVFLIARIDCGEDFQRFRNGIVSELRRAAKWLEEGAPRN